MNEQFYELPQEKQMRIINAGVEVFSQYDYKHASTEEMARKAGISKGLLFYYFHNKKSFYLFLFEYGVKLLLNQIIDDHFKEITDFFDLIQYAAEKKVGILEKMPYLADFVVRCFYEEGEGPGPEVGVAVTELIGKNYQKYFQNIDYSKFRKDVSPKEVYDMLVWMTLGYLHDRRRAGKPIVLKETMDLFYVWEKHLRRIAYEDEDQKDPLVCAGQKVRTI